MDVGRKQLGEVLLDYIPLGTHAILDIGCGDAELVRAYAEAGTPMAVGLELKSAFSHHKLQPSGVGELLVMGDACALPLMDQVFDAILMMNTLHHVGEDRHDQLFGEVYRVLRPDGAFCVIEALCKGPAFEITRLFEDETASRQAAQVSLSRLGAPHWLPVSCTNFIVMWHVTGLATLKAHYQSREGYDKAIEANSTAVADRIKALITCENDEFGLENHVNIRVFKRRCQ